MFCLCLCRTGELRQYLAKQDPLAQWLAPLVGEMPSRHGMICAAAPPVERAIIAIARPNVIDLTREGALPMVLVVECMDIVLIPTFNGLLLAILRLLAHATALAHGLKRSRIP